MIYRYSVAIKIVIQKLSIYITKNVLFIECLRVGGFFCSFSTSVSKIKFFLNFFDLKKNIRNIVDILS